MSTDSDAIARGILKASGSTVLAIVIGTGTWFVCCLLISSVFMVLGMLAGNLDPTIGGLLLTLAVVCSPLVAILPAMVVGVLIIQGVVGSRGKQVSQGERTENSPSS
jgi:hypothetical protein